MFDINACTIYWQNAVEIDRRIRSADRIKVNDKYCYNPNTYSTKGWCELADYPSKWGVCSPMCDPEIMQVYFIQLNHQT